MLQTAMKIVERIQKLPKRWYRLILILVAFISLITFTNSYDYNVMRHWVIAAVLFGMFDIYKAQMIFGHVYRIVYPPLAPLLFVSSVYPLVLLKPYIFLVPYPDLIVRVFAKIPIVLSVIAGYFILKSKVGEKAVKIFLAVPTILPVLTAYVFDVPATITAAASILLIDYPLISGVLLALATLLKQNFIILFISPLLYYISNRDLRGTLLFMSGFMTTTLTLLLPFIVNDGLSNLLYSIVMFHLDRPPQGATLWTIFLVESGYNANFAATVSKLWLPSFLILAAIALYRARGIVKTREGVVLLSALLLSALLATIKVLNCNYLIWLLPFLAALIAYDLVDKRLLLPYNLAVLSALLYSALIIFSSAVIHAPMYLEEERRWIPPSRVEKIVINASPEIMPKLLHFIRATPALYTIFNFIYHYWWIIEPILSLTYTVSMLIIFYHLLRAADTRRGA